MARVGGRVFPCVDEEAVEAAECGEEESCRKQGKAQVGSAGHCGDEDGGGEEDADGELFREAMGGFLYGSGGRSGVDEDEVTGQQASEDEVEMKGGGFKAG